MWQYIENELRIEYGLEVSEGVEVEATNNEFNSQIRNSMCVLIESMYSILVVAAVAVAVVAASTHVQLFYALYQTVIHHLWNIQSVACTTQCIYLFRVSSNL